MLETCPISGGGSAHGLARAVDQKGDFRSGDNEILEGADYTAVDSGIGRETGRSGYVICVGSRNRFSISHAVFVKKGAK